jgi:hypothetical protein
MITRTDRVASTTATAPIEEKLDHTRVPRATPANPRESRIPRRPSRRDETRLAERGSHAAHPARIGERYQRGLNQAVFW